MVGVRFPGLVRIALYTAVLFCKASSVWQTSNCRVNCSVCRRLRCDLGPETSTNTAHQLQGELAIPVPEYGHPHATNNGACSRDAPGPTNSLPLHPRGGEAERRPHRCSGHQHGSGSQTRHRHGAPVRAQLGTPAPAPRACARTTRHASTCNGATVE